MPGSKTSRIPTPLGQHLLRVRIQLVPVVAFLVSAALAVWLWGQHAGLANAVGEAEVARIAMTAPAGSDAW